MTRGNKQSRRRMLKRLAGTGTLVTLAGCTGSDGSDGSDSSDSNNNREAQDDFPSREIEMIVPYSEGGGTDYYARLVMKYLPNHLPNEVNTVVRNVTGGGGRRGPNVALNSDPDGYTLFQSHLENHTIFQYTFEDQVEYNLQEATALGSSARAGRSWIVRSDVLEEYPDWDSLTTAMGNGEVSVATQGQGATAHLVSAVYAELSNDFDFENVNFVHYEGTGPSIPGMIRGDAGVTMGTHDSYIQYVEEEDELEFAFTAAEYAFEDYTSDVEFGVPEDVAEQTRSMLTNERVIFGPPGIPDDRTQILRDGIWDALNDEELQAEAEEAERPIVPTHGEDTQEIVANFDDLWRENIHLVEAISE